MGSDAWHDCRTLSSRPGAPEDSVAYLERIKETYATDAYHSLSIEGYRVSPGLIERARGGTWNPDAEPRDKEQKTPLRHAAIG